MRRSRDRRGTAARIIGWGLVAVAYVTVLAFASGIPAGPAAAQPAAAEAATTQVAGVFAPGPADAGVGDALTAATAPARAAEEPAVTLALAAGMVVLAGLAYGIHTIHGRLARRAARHHDSVAQRLARQITTLM